MSIADEEILHLILAVIKTLVPQSGCSPFLGSAYSKRGSPSKSARPWASLGKVGRNPVQYDAYAVLWR